MPQPKPTTTTKEAPKRVESISRLRWVPIPQTKINPLAQRELNLARVDRMAANFDPERLGHPTVNYRDGWFYIIDGHHRVETLKAVGWGDQQIQCWTYEGLSEEEEAECFLKLNDTLTVDAFAKFRVGVQAGREIESDINRIVLANGLIVSRDLLPGAVRPVGTLRRVYVRAGGPALGRTLRLIRDSFGDAGFEAQVIDGIGLVCQRFNGQFDDKVAAERLGAVHGGVNGLLNEAERTRRATGHQKAHCVAAEVVNVINRGMLRSKKLPDWWKS